MATVSGPKVGLAYCIFGLVLIACAIGCTVGCQRTQEDIQKDEEKYNIPPNAKNVQSIGNYWYIFDFETKGKNRHFLYRHYPAGRASTECITELRE